MFKKIITKIIGGTKSEREMKALAPLLESIHASYDSFSNFTQSDIIDKTAYWKKELSDVREAFLESNIEDEISAKELKKLVFESEQKYLNQILPEAFALLKHGTTLLSGTTINVVSQEMVWEMIPYDVQLLGGKVLHDGKIAEMKTGEGKTLVATLPIYLNALASRGVHVVTVNDYLAERDSQWMGSILEFMGLEVGVILNQMTPDKRRDMYACDVTYGTNSEFGFDYLRDNMASTLEDKVQRDHYYAIVDEVDSILIDEARTPLIISGVVESEVQKRYLDLRPTVDFLVKKQMQLVNSILAEAEVALEDPERQYEAGELILKARKGAPKNKKLLKLYQETGLKKLEQQVENDYMRDKNTHILDEQLYYTIDERQNIVDLTDMGREALSPNNPDMFIIPDLGTELDTIDQNDDLDTVEKNKAKEKLHELHGQRSETIHNMSQLLKAYSLFEKDIDYVVQNGKVFIVDEFTGRILAGRRYSDGLHQALEAKENVKIEKESQTLATITLQNYFRMYQKLAGMTGTALTEAEEFYSIYKLDVVEVPTNRPIVRQDLEDQLYKTRREKYNAVIQEVIHSYQKGQPVLVGTITVDVSETLSRMLKRAKVPHNVLNAKQHGKEAEIVARAGHKFSITIATNMAGRGTDIKLGEGVKELGGLRIIGTERHESRRIDLQLRGRAGRQGDPGDSVFFLSLEDDLMRLFAPERLAGIMDKLGLPEGEVITAGMVTKAVERAQKKVEARNFGIRKHLLEYDDVMNQQREIVYDRRSIILDGENIEDEYSEMLQNFVDAAVDNYTHGENNHELWDWDGLKLELASVTLTQYDKDPEGILKESLSDDVLNAVLKSYEMKKQISGDAQQVNRLQQFVALRVTDEKWREHLYEMDQLREGINLRAVGQKDPLIEYKREGFGIFSKLLDLIDREVLKLFFHARIVEQNRPMFRQGTTPRNISVQHASADGMAFSQAQRSGLSQEQSGIPQRVAPNTEKLAPVRIEQKIGRNDPCPCGSGKKYKKCHGKTAE